MRKYIILCFILLAAQLTSLAQSVPGYMGKKNTIQVGPSYAALGSQLSWQLGYHRTVSRHGELGIQYYNVSGDIFKDRHSGSIGSSLSSISHRFNYKDGTVPGRIKVEYIGLDYRRYLTSYLAPLGTNIEFGIGRLMAKGEKNSTIKAEVSNTGEVVKIDANQTFTHISMGVNQKWMLAGGNVFIEIGAIANYFWTSEYEKNNNYSSYRTEAEFFATEFKRDFLLRNALHAKLSLGYTF